MEFCLRRSADGQEAEPVKEEDKTSTDELSPHNHHHDEQARNNTTLLVQAPLKNNTAADRSIVDIGPRQSSSSAKKEQVDELESARVEMGEVREENQRLKMCLDRIMKEYQALQMQFHVIAQQEKASTTPISLPHDHRHQKPNNIIDDDNNNNEESDLVSLSLGRVPSTTSNQKSKLVTSKQRQDNRDGDDEELALGLDCKFETSKSGSTNEALPNTNGSPTNSSELVHNNKEEEAGESWGPSSNKGLDNNNNKSPRRDSNSADQDEVSQQSPAKKARVCVRARCDTPTLNDGCQWRKYGQKISKGNPCPRAYYRCTVAPNCPVRKQVQRCAEDMTILITTYEGNHNHPLPLSATAMASTTSAAASMLLSGSSSTSNNPTGLAPSSTATATISSSGNHLPAGMNLYLSDNNGTKPKQFYLSNPTLLSPSPSHPTITLDLTTSNPNNPSSNYFSSHFNRFNNISPNYNNTPPPTRFPPSTTSLSFGSSDSLSSSWPNSNNNVVGFLGYNNYNTHQTYNNVTSRNILSSINNLAGRQPSVLPDTIAAATKVITADPNFQTVLAAAVTSIIGTGNTNNINSGTSSAVTGNNSASSTQQGVVGEINLGRKVNPWGDNFAASGGSGSSSKVSGCGSSFLSKTRAATVVGAAGTQAAGSSGLMFLPPSSLPISSSKTASGVSPADNNRDKSNS